MAETAVIETKFGEIEIEFMDDLAPGHVKNFLDLARKGFYDGTTFHRVIPKFMCQGGDFTRGNAILNQPGDLLCCPLQHVRKIPMRFEG